MKSKHWVLELSICFDVKPIIPVLPAVPVGLPELHFHDLRRSAVRNFVRAGVPQHVAMRITGHQTASMFRRYDIVDERDIAEAGEKIVKYFKTVKEERGTDAGPQKVQ